MKVRANKKALRLAILESGLGFKDLVKETNTSTATISKIMKQSGDVNSTTAVRVAKALNKPVTELFTVE